MIPGSDHSWYDWAGQDAITGGYYYIPINFAASRAVFVFLKACDGASETMFYPQAIHDARLAGKLAAPYVWLYPANHTDPRAQAQFWFDRLCMEPLIAIDFEGYSVWFPNYDDLYNAIEKLRALGYTGNIIIYTGHWYWLAHGSTAEYWGQFPVWLARYSTEQPQATPPWDKWTIWQYSASGDPADYGVTNGKKAVDENWFDGTQEELEALFGGEYIPPSTDGGNDMVTYLGTTLVNLNYRKTPGGVLIGTMPVGTKVEADRIENGYWHLTKIGSTVQTQDAWAYQGDTNGYIRLDGVANSPVGETTVDVYVNEVLVHTKTGGGNVRIDITD